MKTYSVYGFPPPIPDSYPAVISICNATGAVIEYTLNSEKEYRMMHYWHWQCRPAGHSINSPLQRDVDGGDLQVGGQT